MIVRYESNLTLKEYVKLGKKNDFPVIECCPRCRGVVRLKRHGFYWRNAIEPGAGKTFLLRSFADSLPDSLYKVVYFPLSTVTVMDFYRGIARGLGEDPKFHKVDLFHQIQEAILR